MGDERRGIRAWFRPKWWWTRFWMRFAGTGSLGRKAAWLAALFAPPYKARRYLASLNPKGYVSAKAEIYCRSLRLGAHVFLGDRVVICAMHEDAGVVELGDRVHLHRGTIIEVGAGGSLAIGADTHIQPGCLFAAYMAPIKVGEHVQIAPGCRFYPFDHSYAAGELIAAQPLQTKGGIVLEDDVWLGAGVTVLDGVRIGHGAIIGAGAVVKSDIAPDAIAAGVPARVIGMRNGSGSRGTD